MDMTLKEIYYSALYDSEGPCDNYWLAKTLDELAIVAKEQQDKAAMCLLAACYVTGIRGKRNPWIKRNPRMARQLVEKADLDCDDAKFVWGVLYTEGLAGLTIDVSKGLNYWKRIEKKENYPLLEQKIEEYKRIRHRFRIAVLSSAGMTLAALVLYLAIHSIHFLANPAQTADALLKRHILWYRILIAGDALSLAIAVLSSVMIIYFGIKSFPYIADRMKKFILLLWFYSIALIGIFAVVIHGDMIMGDDVPGNLEQAKEDLAQIESGEPEQITVWLHPDTRQTHLPGPLIDGQLDVVTRYAAIGEEKNHEWTWFYVPLSMDFSPDEDTLYNENQMVEWNEVNTAKYVLTYTSNFHLVLSVEEEMPAMSEDIIAHTVITRETYESSDGDSHEYTYEYDDDGNLIRETLEYGDGYEYTCEYDDNGNLLWETSDYGDGDVDERVYEYDSDGNLLRETFESSDGYSSELTYEYDRNGNLLWEAYENSDGDSHVCTYEYDSGGKPIKATNDANDDYSSEHTYEYNSAGNLLREVYERYESSNGVSYEYTHEYDDDGNLLREVYDDGGVVSHEYTFEYDGDGNLLRKTYENVEYSAENTYEYDSAGNLLREVYESSGLGSHVYTCEYDSAGNLLREMYEGSNGDSCYSWKRIYEYDSAGKPLREIHESSYGYDRNYERTYEYDSMGNLIQKTEVRNGEEYVETYTYEYAYYANREIEET